MAFTIVQGDYDVTFTDGISSLIATKLSVQRTIIFVMQVHDLSLTVTIEFTDNELFSLLKACEELIGYPDPDYKIHFKNGKMFGVQDG